MRQDEEIQKKLENALSKVRQSTAFVPKVALVLGSGLGGFANNLRVEKEIPYAEIDGFPISTVQGHDGRFIFGWIDETPVVCMKGRVHYYEGYSMTDVVMPVRLMRLLGAEILVLTNAVGAINESFQPGDLMLIKDHISMFIPNPLIGPNLEKFGTRFPDMSKVYDPGLLELIRQTAREKDIYLREGVYTQLTGPSYETPAEIRALRVLGSDVVGMSTVIEAIAANHAGMRICGISCISNMAAGINGRPLNHLEVQEAATKASKTFESLLIASIQKMGKE